MSTFSTIDEGINRIDSIGTTDITDKSIILQVKAMNRFKFVGILICLTTTFIGFLLEYWGFCIVGLATLTIL